MSHSGEVAATRNWYIASRWQEYEGEFRVHLVRIGAVGALYAVQLVRFLSVSDVSQRDVPFHRMATLLAVAGTLMSLAILLCLRREIFPPLLKYVATVGDIVMLTFLAHLGRGPESPLVLGLFVVIALAGLRFSLGLIGFATVACMLAYLGLVGARDPHWFDSDHAVPPTQQVITLICLALLGIVQGQIARRLKIVAEYYAQRQQIAVSRRKDA